MATVLRLTVLTGPHKNEKFCFCGLARCLIGRAEDCFVRLAGTPRDTLISRHHCQLILEPPVLTLNDLASSNGTFINGTRVNSVELPLTSAATWQSLDADSILSQGNLLTTGGTTFKVDLVECPPRDKAATVKPLWEEGEAAKRGCPIPCS
jgi:pSer/pThr/pTyr-binding forkhead associated (FHA) protein